MSNTKRISQAFRARGGFTLIELLVVISIIALLIGILLPALGKARFSALKTVDAGNNRSLSQGLFIFGADNQDSIPLGWSGSLQGNYHIWNNYAWADYGDGWELLGKLYENEIITSREVYECPGYRGITEEYWEDGTDWDLVSNNPENHWPPGEEGFREFGARAMYGVRPESDYWRVDRPHNMQEYGASSRNYYFNENTRWMIDPNNQLRTTAQMPKGTNLTFPSMTSTVSARLATFAQAELVFNGEGINVGYGDGHTEWFSGSRWDLFKKNLEDIPPQWIFNPAINARVMANWSLMDKHVDPSTLPPLESYLGN